MRIIPKKTKVKLEFFKGIELLDVIVGLVGAVFTMAVFLSDLPFHIWISLLILVIFIGLIIPMDGEKAYMMVYNSIKYYARHKIFQRAGDAQEPSKKVTPTVEDISAFTGITGEFIEYGPNAF